VSKRITMDVLKWITLMAFVLLFLFPFFWIVASSLKSRGEFFTRPPLWLSLIHI